MNNLKINLALTVGLLNRRNSGFEQFLPKGSKVNEKDRIKVKKNGPFHKSEKGRKKFGYVGMIIFTSPQNWT